MTWTGRQLSKIFEKKKTKEEYITVVRCGNEIYVGSSKKEIVINKSYQVNLLVKGINLNLVHLLTCLFIYNNPNLFNKYIMLDHMFLLSYLDSNNLLKKKNNNLIRLKQAWRNELPYLTKTQRGNRFVIWVQSV